MDMPRIEQIKYFDTFLQGTQKRTNVVYGGAGSGKSVAVAQHILSKFLREKDKRILITRKTLPSLRITAWTLITHSLKEWGIPCEINKSEFSIRFGDNEILAKSMDDPEKIKSAEFNYIWIEEATELAEDDYKQLDLRLRRESRDGKQNQIYLTFNPIDQFHWVIKNLVQGNRPDVAIHHSTYKNNPFVTPEYAARLEQFINEDENFYRVYTLGEPGVLENTIYRNYCTCPWPQNHNPEDSIFGLDFGFNNQSALVELAMRDGTLYLRELLYQSHLTNADLIAKLKELNIPPANPIYADAAEPQRIEEIYTAGWNIKPADKSVKDGIDFLKRYRLHIHPDSANILNEIRAYSYRKDKNGQVLEEPVKFRDHLMDAARYGAYTHWHNPEAEHILLSGGFGEQENRR